MEDKEREIRPYDETEDIVESHERDDWGEWDEDDGEENYDPTLDPAFRDWEEVNGMFFRRDF